MWCFAHSAKTAGAIQAGDGRLGCFRISFQDSSLPIYVRYTTTWIGLWPFCPFRPFFQSQSWPLLLSATCIVGSFCHDLERFVWKQKLRTHSRGLALPFYQLNEPPKTNYVSDQVSNGHNWKSCIYLIVESSIENQVLRMPSDKLALHRRLLIPTEPSYLSKQRRTN